MRKSVFVFLLSVFLTAPILAAWAFIPLDELVADSDLIVIGTLHSAVEDSDGIGSGSISVDQILTKGAQTLDGESLKATDNIKITWADNWACADGMHKGRIGKKAIWLLKLAEDGTATAAYPERFLPIDKYDEVKKYLGDKKITDTARVKIEKKTIETSLADKPADLSQHYSLNRALVTFFAAFGLYLILYKSRFRIR